MENEKVFLDKVTQDVSDGKYDEYLTIPFMTRNLILTSIKSKFQKRIQTNGTPMLTDGEIKTCIEDAKEAAAATFHLFNKFGFLEQAADGKVQISAKGKLALRQSMLL